MADQSTSATLQTGAERDGERLLSTQPTTVRPLFYTELRLLAECAEGIATDVEFLFDDGILTVNPPNNPPPDDQILITASDPGRRPDNYVGLQVDTGAGTPLPLANADAVFWSDAAVQKFLFPYIASCAGHEAGEMLTLVQSAWNFYPTDQVTVYALVHTITQPGTPLRLADIVQVAYTVPGGSNGVQLLPLAEFVGRFPPVPYTNPTLPQVGYWRGVAVSPPAPPYPYPDYLALRALAEHAASLGEQALVSQDWAYFTLPLNVTPFPLFQGPFQTLDPDQVEGTIVVPVFNPTIPFSRPQLEAVWFQPAGFTVPPVNLCVPPGQPGWATSADALFWSTGAAEKFLYPYYASTGGFDGLAELTKLADTWRLNQPVALPPDQPPVVIPVPGTGAAQVLGLIHMPTSEWTEIETESQGGGVAGAGGRISAGREVGVLYADAGGQVHVARASEFRAKNPPRQG